MASNLDMTPIAVPNGALADDVDRGATPKMSWPKQQFAKAPTGTRDRDLAKSVFESAIQANPHDSFTYHKLGLLYEEEYSDRTAAIQCFEHAVELNPKNAPALNSLGLACKGQDPQKALQYYQRCIAVEPEYGRAHKNLGLLYLNELNDHGKARQCFLECIRVDPNNASAFISLGQLCERQKEWKAAEDYFKMGVECDPRNPMGYFRLGILYQTLKNLEQSKYYYELAVSKAPTDVRIVSKLAKLLESDHFKDYVGARKLYRTALHYNPEEQWLVNRIRYIETKNIKTDPETGALMVQPQDNEIIPDINMNEMERANSSDHHAAAPNRGLCPRNHSLACIYAKPSTYRPQATWACEECHKSIGGVDLKVNGAYHCPICKYDLCSQCSGKPRRAHEIKPDESRKLGEGGFGVVYREYDYATRAYVAVKHVQTPTERMINDVKREVKIMRQFDKSPYIVKVLRADFDRQPTAVARIYLELMDSSVASLLDTQGPVHETQARVWIHNAACGLATLHTFRQQVLHRDIKPENLLLKDHKVKLSDFGLSKSVEGSTLGTTGGPKGTPQYTAPEIFESNPPEYTYAADIWSLACTWIVMVTGRPPWHGLVDSGAGFHALCYQLMQKKSPTIPTHLSQPAQDLLRRMLDFDRRRRPTAEMILADDYFKTSSNDIAKNAESEEDYERRRQAVLDARAREKEREKDSEHLVSMSSGIVGDGYLMTPTTGAPTNLGHFPAMDNSAIVSAMPLKPHPSNADLTSPQSPNGLSVVTTASMTRVGTASSVPEMEALGSNVDTTGSGGSNGTVPRSIAAPFVPQPSPGLSRNGGRGPINRQRPKFARAPPPPYSAADATNPATATSGSTSMVNSPPPAPSSATASPPPATDTPTVAIVMPPLSPDATRESRNPPASAPSQESRRWVLSAVAIVAVVLLYSAAGV